MLKKSVAMAGLVLSLMANAAWAGDANGCLYYESENNGTRWLTNNCAKPVEAIWCFGTYCSFQTDGNSWTIQPNSRFPITGGNSSDFLRHDACFGANSIKERSRTTVSCK